MDLVYLMDFMIEKAIGYFDHLTLNFIQEINMKTEEFAEQIFYEMTNARNMSKWCKRNDCDNEYWIGKYYAFREVFEMLVMDKSPE